jgi:hypothetical protein
MLEVQSLELDGMLHEIQVEYINRFMNCRSKYFAHDTGLLP